MAKKKQWYEVIADAVSSRVKASLSDTEKTKPTLTKAETPVKPFSPSATKINEQGEVTSFRPTISSRSYGNAEVTQAKSKLGATAIDVVGHTSSGIVSSAESLRKGVEQTAATLSYLTGNKAEAERVSNNATFSEAPKLYDAEGKSVVYDPTSGKDYYIYAYDNTQKYIKPTLIKYTGAEAPKNMTYTNAAGGVSYTADYMRNLESQAVDIWQNKQTFDRTAAFTAEQKNSVINNTIIEDVFEGVGQVAFTAPIMFVPGGIVASGAMNYLQGVGSGVDQAKQAGADLGTALGYGAGSGLIQAGTEALYGGVGGFLGKGALDEVVVGNLTKGIKNNLLKNVVQYGMSMSGEGVEEVVAGILDSALQIGTYNKDKKYMDVLGEQDLAQQFIVASLAAGVVQSGGAIKSTVNGVDILYQLSPKQASTINGVVSYQNQKAKESGETTKKLSFDDGVNIYRKETLDELTIGVSNGVFATSLGEMTGKLQYNPNPINPFAKQFVTENKELLDTIKVTPETIQSVRTAAYMASKGVNTTLSTSQEMQTMLPNINAKVAAQVPAFVLRDTVTAQPLSLVVNVDSKEAIPAAIAHEVLHMSKNTSVYTDISDFVMEYLSASGKMESLVEDVTSRYNQLALTPEDLNEEVIANGITAIMQENPEALKQIFGEVESKKGFAALQDFFAKKFTSTQESTIQKQLLGKIQTNMATAISEIEKQSITAKKQVDGRLFRSSGKEGELTSIQNPTQKVLNGDTWRYAKVEGFGGQIYADTSKYKLFSPKNISSRDTVRRVFTDFFDYFDSTTSDNEYADKKYTKLFTDLYKAMDIPTKKSRKLVKETIKENGLFNEEAFLKKLGYDGIDMRKLNGTDFVTVLSPNSTNQSLVSVLYSDASPKTQSPTIHYQLPTKDQLEETKGDIEALEEIFDNMSGSEKHMFLKITPIKGKLFDTSGEWILAKHKEFKELSPEEYMDDEDDLDVLDEEFDKFLEDYKDRQLGYEFTPEDFNELEREYLDIFSEGVGPSQYETELGVPKRFPLKGLSKVGEQLGSNKGGFYRDNDGHNYYVKFMDEAHAINEFLASRLYTDAGIRVPKLRIGYDEKLGTAIVSPLIEANKLLGGDVVTLEEAKKNPELKKKAYDNLKKGFLMDAWLANWDVAGMNYDNVMVNTMTGDVYRIDAGGSLLFRAMGSPKGKALSSTSVPEIDTLRDEAMNPTSSDIFSGLSAEDLTNQLIRFSQVFSDDSYVLKRELDKVFGNTNAPSKQQQEYMTILDGRRKYILEKYSKILAEKRASTVGTREDGEKILTSISQLQEARQSNGLNNYYLPADEKGQPTIFAGRITEDGQLIPSELAKALMYGAATETDSLGRIKKFYHGTTGGGFKQFDTGYIGNGVTFLTDNILVAGTYANDDVGLYAKDLILDLKSFDDISAINDWFKEKAELYLRKKDTIPQHENTFSSLAKAFETFSVREEDGLTIFSHIAPGKNPKTVETPVLSKEELFRDISLIAYETAYSKYVDYQNHVSPALYEVFPIIRRKIIIEGDGQEWTDFRLGEDFVEQFRGLPIPPEIISNVFELEDNAKNTWSTDIFAEKVKQLNDYLEKNLVGFSPYDAIEFRNILDTSVPSYDESVGTLEDLKSIVLAVLNEKNIVSVNNPNPSLSGKSLMLSMPSREATSVLNEGKPVETVTDFDGKVVSLKDIEDRFSNSTEAKVLKPRLGSFIFPDGKKYASFKNDHATTLRNVAKITLKDAQRLGIIRSHLQYGFWEMTKMPTNEQLSVIKDEFKQMVDGVIPMNKQVSNAPSISLYLGEKTNRDKGFREYPVSTNPYTIERDIREFYRTGELPRQSKMSEFMMSMPKKPTVESREKKVEAAEKRIAKKEATLAKQLEQIKKQKETIKKQKETVKKKKETVAKQKEKVKTKMQEITGPPKELTPEEKAKKKRVKAYRRAKYEAFIEVDNLLPEKLEDAMKDTATTISLDADTIERNLRKVFKDQEVADKIYNEVFYGINEAGKEKMKYYTQLINRAKDLDLNKHERVYAQMYGEYLHNPDSKFQEDKTMMQTYYSENKESIDMKKVSIAVEEFRAIYDELYDMINGVNERYGYEPLAKRAGYFPHYRSTDGTLAGKIKKQIGWRTFSDRPQSLEQMKAEYKATRFRSPHSMQRTTDVTEYDLYEGLDNYLEFALDHIFYTESVVKLRAFEQALLNKTADKEVRKKIREVLRDEKKTSFQKDEEIMKIYRTAQTPIKHFLNNLSDYTDMIANKRSYGAKWFEGRVGEKAYEITVNLENRLKANMIGANISSAMTQFVPVSMVMAATDIVSTLKGISGMVTSSLDEDDYITANSVFLGNRVIHTRRLAETGIHKAEYYASSLFRWFDDITSQIVVRSGYDYYLKRGMTQEEALKQADQLAYTTMAGRNKGSMPLMFTSKNPFLATVTMFQLEVNNYVRFLKDDIPRLSKLDAQLKGKQRGKVKVDGDWEDIASKMIGMYLKLFVGTWIYNAIFQKAFGRKVVLNPIDIIADSYEIVGRENLSSDEKVIEIASRFGKEIPFVGGYFFGGGRLPISSAIPRLSTISYALKTFTEQDPDKQETAKNGLIAELQKPLFYLGMPMAGGQVKKTMGAIDAISRDVPGSYTASGQLRYTVPTDTPSKIRMLLLGVNSTPEAREFYGKGLTPLSKEQQDVMKRSQLSIEEYRDVLARAKQIDAYAKTHPTTSNAVESKLFMVNGMTNLDINQKNTLAQALVPRKDPINMDLFSQVASMEEYDYASQNPEKYKLIKSIGGEYDKYIRYDENITKIKDEYKDSTVNERKQAVWDYISRIPTMDDTQRAILMKMYYTSFTDYDDQVVEYLYNFSGLTNSGINSEFEYVSRYLKIDWTKWGIEL